MRVVDLDAIRIKLASPQDILSWSHGEVTKPETINYRTQRAEKDGLFDERIFGPEKDYECYCGKYRKIRYKGVVCDRCGVEVTKAAVRRERMGHLELAVPCSHIWFLKGVPSRMGLVLDIPAQALEHVIYFAAYIVTKVNEEARVKTLQEIETEFRHKSKGKDEKEKEALKEARDSAKQELGSLERLRIISEVEYQNLALRYGDVFEAGTGAETLRKIFEEVDLAKTISVLTQELERATPQNRRKLLARIRLLQGMKDAGIRPEWMFLTALPILPPDLRPMVQLDGGRYASSDLNDLYRRVINRNNRLKYLLEIGAPEVIVRNEKRMLQEAVDALIDNGMRKATMTTATTGGKRLLKSLADMLKGKQGRFRQNLLGKRVDYSGRSVIVVGPELRLDQCGLPKRMALELFKPFVIHRILEKELAYNVRGASRLVEQETDEVWAILEEVVADKLVLLNRAPTLHRLGIQAFYPILTEGEAIHLHPLVCEAFNADFDGDQMAVHVPLSDQAQREAKELMLSAANLLKPATGNPIVGPRQDMVLGCYFLTGVEASPSVPAQDKAGGEESSSSLLEEGGEGNTVADEEGRTGDAARAKQQGTKNVFGSREEALLAYENGLIGLRQKVRVRLDSGVVVREEGTADSGQKNEGEGKMGLLETTPGRIIFNESLPEEYPYVNEQMNAKRLGQVTADIIKMYSQEEAREILDKIKELGFEYATESGVTWGMGDLIVPPAKAGLLAAAEKEIETIDSHWRHGLLSREERSAKVIEVWQRVKSTIEKLVPKTLPHAGSVFSIIDSGARGSWSQPIQMSGMKGLVINPAGRIIELPVKNSFKEGFDVLEYFISTHGARKGTADTALRTSTAGYLTRRLIDVSHDVLVVQKDCKDAKGILILKKDAQDLGQNLALKIGGRVAAEDVGTFVKKGEVIDWDAALRIADADDIREIRVRSSLSCKTPRGLCQKCYGWDLGTRAMVELGSAVGIVAAQSIGEPGTQLTMRTFHTGGVAGGGDITQGLPRVEEIFEGRVPGGKAVISEIEGVVQDITQEGTIRIQPTAAGSKGKGEAVEYEVPGKRAIWVQKGDTVQKGQQLCEGSLDLAELFKVAGKEETQRYVAQEVQKIYTSQGASIHDKHIEVITRQMFSRVRVRDKGDSKFSEGEIADRATYLEEKERLQKANKKPPEVEQLLLGISKIALTTESFLSAASFQETSRVLIKAALEGKEDKLRGLKENVIIGKLIPAGTGFKKEGRVV